MSWILNLQSNSHTIHQAVGQFLFAISIIPFHSPVAQASPRPFGVPSCPEGGEEVHMTYHGSHYAHFKLELFAAPALICACHLCDWFFITVDLCSPEVLDNHFVA